MKKVFIVILITLSFATLIRLYQYSQFTKGNISKNQMKKYLEYKLNKFGNLDLDYDVTIRNTKEIDGNFLVLFTYNQSETNYDYIGYQRFELKNEKLKSRTLLYNIFSNANDLMLLDNYVYYVHFGYLHAGKNNTFKVTQKGTDEFINYPTDEYFIKLYKLEYGENFLINPAETS